LETSTDTRPSRERRAAAMPPGLEPVHPPARRAPKWRPSEV